ncbi:MAG TPA: sugar transferase [Syntrophorhabdaceae bacterium]|nr:sugar transferase [Syntrophorhabdaceae bacterium]
MKRIFDLFVAFILSCLLLLPVICIALLIKLSSKGPALYWSKRVGIGNDIFLMPKFRTMRIDTPDVATHLLENPDVYLIPVGSFLRKYSLDEFPQIWSVMKGDMSIVGPRPALYNQHDLIELRTARGIHNIVPGITGWAQVNGRDTISIPVKVDYDEYYLKNRSFLFDLRILWMTFQKVIRSEDVKH